MKNLNRKINLMHPFCYLIPFILFLQGCGTTKPVVFERGMLDPSAKIGVRSGCSIYALGWHCESYGSKIRIHDLVRDANVQKMIENEFISECSRLMPFEISNAAHIKVKDRGTVWSERSRSVEDYKNHGLDAVIHIFPRVTIEGDGTVRMSCYAAMHRISDNELIWNTPHICAEGGVLNDGDPCSSVNEKLKNCVDSVVFQLMSNLRYAWYH